MNKEIATIYGALAGFLTLYLVGAWVTWDLGWMANSFFSRMLTLCFGIPSAVAGAALALDVWYETRGKKDE